MPEETRISPRHFEEFLPWLADDVLNGIARCMGKGWQKWVKGEPHHKVTPKESAEVEQAAKYIVMALQMGLLLAKRQPELADVPLRSLEARGALDDELWRGMMEVYQGFLWASGCQHSERHKISPEHFEEFLAYCAITWLREIATHMDKEWQKGWQKRVKGEPSHKAKPGEGAKVEKVGNRVIGAILSGLVVAKRQPELLSVDWSRGASLDTLWQGIQWTYTRFLYYKHFA